MQAEKELRDILVMALPYKFSLGFLLKAHCASARSGKGTADPRVFAGLWPSWILHSWQTYLGFGGKARVIKEDICRTCSPCPQLLDSTCGALSCIPCPVCYSRRGRSTEVVARGWGRGRGGVSGTVVAPATASPHPSPALFLSASAPQHHDDCSGHVLERSQVFSSPAAASLPRSLPSWRCVVEFAALCGLVAIWISSVLHTCAGAHTYLHTHIFAHTHCWFFFFLFFLSFFLKMHLLM